MELHPDQIDERRELLCKCLGMAAIQAQSFAHKLGEEQFLGAINGTCETMLGMNMRRPDLFPDFYFGKFYTIENYRLLPGSRWEAMEKDILQCLTVERQAREVIEFFLNQPGSQADFAGVKARFTRWRNTLDSLLGFRLLCKLPTRAKDNTVYALRAEIVPLIRRVLESPKSQELPVINSEAAQAELAQVMQMEQRFDDHLHDLVQNRLAEVEEFGRGRMSLHEVTTYLEGLFGPMLYFDCLLAIAHQYGMTATEIVNAEGTRAGSTGFHLALFGAPGTGKTFAVKDLIMGDESKNVLAHGLPGLNRYCGGMTAAIFIRIGEAYQGKRFNFVVTEFNDWFRYKGMVEPLKLALEQGKIRYETKTETIGPYQFSCYFATNYNTEVNRPDGYKVTIGDPNFNAIEDRMLVRMHRMTKQRLRELSRNQRELALGRLRMGLAKDVRDHLTLVYAIQTRHPLVKDRFARKQVVLRESFFEALDQAQDAILDQIKGSLQFSVRVRQNAMKLAGALTLFSYFQQSGDSLEITEEAQRLALKFFVEEIAIRQKIGVDIEGILYRLGLSDLNRLDSVVASARNEREDPDAAATLDRWRIALSHELRLLESKYAPDAGWDELVEPLRKTFGPTWNHLDDAAQDFLSTGEVLLHELHRLGGDQCDYSPVIVEYAKALEVQLSRRCFDAFRSEMIERGRSAEPLFFEFDETAADLGSADRRQLQQTLDVLRKYIRDEQKLTLGQMWHCVLRTRHEPYGSPVVASLRAFCGSRAELSAILTEDFVRSLNVFLTEFRNHAAHTVQLDHDAAKKCRELLIGAGSGLLFQLVSCVNQPEPVAS